MTEETNPIEQLGTVDSYQEAMEAFLKELSENIDPADFIPPSQREIAKLTVEELTAEYELVQQKSSTRSAAQRKYIVQRFEYEQNKEDANEE